MTFYPSHSGISLYSSDFAFYAAEKGHNVKVITGFPFYPNWKKRAEDKRVLFRKESIEGVDVYRGYLYVPSIPNTFRRMIQEVTFLISTFINFIRVGKPDVIVTFTTPVSLGFIGALFKMLYGCKLVINVQDFQIEAASSLEMTNGLVLNGISKLEAFSYKKADIVSSISQSMKNLLIKKKKISERKALLWPNWIDLNEFKEPDGENIFRLKHGFSKDITLIGYAGNIGEKQGLKVLIDLAKRLEHISNLHFLIIGEGSDLVNLKNYHKSKSIVNLSFLPFLNPEAYKYFLKDVDAIFISQKKTKKDVYFPSKLLGIMALSKMLLISADSNSELYKTMNDNKLALVSEFGDISSLEQHVKYVCSNSRNSKTKYQKNAFEFVQKFDKKNLLENIIKKITRE